MGKIPQCVYLGQAKEACLYSFMVTESFHCSLPTTDEFVISKYDWRFHLTDPIT
jgi:hypothetical protein